MKNLIKLIVNTLILALALLVMWICLAVAQAEEWTHWCESEYGGIPHELINAVTEDKNGTSQTRFLYASCLTEDLIIQSGNLKDWKTALMAGAIKNGFLGKTLILRLTSDGLSSSKTEQLRKSIEMRLRLMTADLWIHLTIVDANGKVIPKPESKKKKIPKGKYENVYPKPPPPIKKSDIEQPA